MKRTADVIGITAAAALLGYLVRVRLDPRSLPFALVIVWLPMTWLGTVSHLARIRLPGSLHRLRTWELDGHVYERLGVRVAKRLLRRGPFTIFNPHLRLPARPARTDLDELDDHMRSAEATHALLFVALLPVVAHAVARGWWWAAAWTLTFNTLINVYPAMLQRYNRALLLRRRSGVSSA